MIILQNIIGVDIGGTKCSVILGDCLSLEKYFNTDIMKKQSGFNKYIEFKQKVNYYENSNHSVKHDESSNNPINLDERQEHPVSFGESQNHPVDFDEKQEHPVVFDEYPNHPVIPVIKDKIKFPTELQKGVNFSINKILDNIQTILERNNLKKEEISCIGVSCGGPLDSERGIILSPPNLPGWDNIRITGILEKKFGIKVNLQNDANACALAEWKFGAGQGYKNVVFLTFGTGMGAGLILDGRLYNGTNGMAGEIGHVRLSDIGPVGYGKAGSFEGFCSGGGIKQLAEIKVREKLQKGLKVSFCKSYDDLNRLDAKIVADAADNGDEVAKEIYFICGNYLGRGLSILIDILNPEIIIIGSIFCRSEKLLRDAAMDVIDRECIGLSRKVCKIVPSSLGEMVGDYGTLAAALYT